MIFKKINFKLMSIILLFFCSQQIKCKHVEKRSIMQDMMSNFMQMIDPKSNQRHMPFKIIKSETIDGKVQKYTVPNVDDDKMKDLNNAIKLLSIQNMLNRHYKNQYRKHKMMKELEHLSKGNENNPQLQKLNEHTIKKYKYIDNYNNHRFNKEMLRLQKQAQKLINSSPELFKNVNNPNFFVQNAHENSNTKPDFYTNSHGPEQTLRSKYKNENSGNVQETPQVFLLSPNDVSTHDTSNHISSPNQIKYTSSGKPIYQSDHLKYYFPPLSNEALTQQQKSHMKGYGQRHRPKELSFAKPYLGPKEIPWSMKQKSPTVFLPSQQELPWSVVPLPPPLPTLSMGASNAQYTWALGGLPPPLGENVNTGGSSDMNSYWALKPLPPPMQTSISNRNIKATVSTSNPDCKSNEDITLESTSDPLVINTYMRNNALKTEISNENYDDLHITQESTLKTYTVDSRNKNDSKTKVNDGSQQMKQESTMQQYSINPILAQQYQRYNNQQKNIFKSNNNTQNINDNSKQKDNPNNKTIKKQEQVQASTTQKETKVANTTTFTRKYQPRNQNKPFINPEQAQNFNVNQEKILQQRQQQLKQFYEKQKQQRQLIRNNNKNLLPETKNVQDGGRSYMFNSKLNTQHVAAIPIDIAIPIEESDWIPIQPKYLISQNHGNFQYEYDNMPLSQTENDRTPNKNNPISNVDVMMVFSNETKVGGSGNSSNLEVKEKEKSISSNETLNQETRPNISNDEVQNVDENIRKLTFSKPIYEVPIVNTQNSINSEKTVVIEVLNSNHIKTGKKPKTDKKINSVDDITGSESNTVTVKVRYENQTNLHSTKERLSDNDEHVSPVKKYERVKIKTKHKKYETLNPNHNINTNQTIQNDTHVFNNNTSLNKSFHHLDSEKVDIKDYHLLSEVTTEKQFMGNNDGKIENNKLNNTGVTSVLNDTLDIEFYEEKPMLEMSSLVEDRSNEEKEMKNILPHIKESTTVGVVNRTNTPLPIDSKFDHSIEYEQSGSNIKELIANRSKIIRPFFRNKQNLNFTSTTTTSTTTTMKPIVVKQTIRKAPNTVRDQKFEESKTHNNYDDYDDQVSFENIKAAQEFNFPKTDISYSVNLPKSSQSVFKSVGNERTVSPGRKQSTRNRYRTEESRHRYRPSEGQKNQNDYENREEQSFVTPTYDENGGQYSVYENTNPFETSGSSFFNDGDTSQGSHVDLKNIKIPSPEDIDLDSIDIPNPETVKVRGIGSGLDEESSPDHEKEEGGDDEEEIGGDKESDNDGDVDEEAGDDADNEESKTRNKVDKSFRTNYQQPSMDSEKSHTEKHFDVSGIPIPQFDENHMNRIKQKYNIPSSNLENIQHQEQQNPDDQSAIIIPQDHLVRNEYNDEIPNYNVPIINSQEEHNDEHNSDNIDSKNINDGERNSGQQSFPNSYEHIADYPYNTHSNSYTLNNENHNFPFISDEEKFKLRNLLKKPPPDHFDQDENFGYAKFSDEDHRGSEFDDFDEGAYEKQDLKTPSDKFMLPSQDLSSLRNMPSSYPRKTSESHLVKQIPIGFKTVIKPVSYDPQPFRPMPHRFQKSYNGIQQPFRPSPQTQFENQARFISQQNEYQSYSSNEQNKQKSNGHTPEYIGNDKGHYRLGDELPGKHIQTEIIPAQEYDLQQNGGIFRDPYENQFKHQVPQHPQTRFNTNEQNVEKDFSTNFDPTSKGRSQLGSPLPATQSSNNSPGTDIFSDLKKVKSFANMNIQRFTSSGQPISMPNFQNGGNNQIVQQSIFGHSENAPPSSNYFLSSNGHNFQNQLETPHRAPNPSNSNSKQGLIVYHPTKSQMTSVSHVLITPPTVERERQTNQISQPQIQEKNFQFTTVSPDVSQKHIRAQTPRVAQKVIAKQTSSQQPDAPRLRYINNYSSSNRINNQQTNTLQQINKSNRGPQGHNRPRLPTKSQNNNNFRNIPVRDQKKNGNFRPQLPPPRPTLTLQQIQSIKSSNLPPHIREYSEFNKPRYEFSQVKNIQSLQIPHEQSNQQNGNYDESQNTPIEQNEYYSNQEHVQRPYVGSYNNENYNTNYRPQTIRNYNHPNGGTVVHSTIEANDSEEDENNNSEENEGKDERIRPNDPTHHDTESKELYLNNGGQDFIEQKYQYQTPNNNEFVQNIRIPQKIPKIEKLRVTNEFTNVNVNQYNKYHPEPVETHFSPTPTPEHQLTTSVKQKGKARKLIFTPSQRDPFTNNLQLSTPSYTLQDPTTPTHNFQPTLSPAHYSHNVQSSTLSPPYVSSTQSSLPEHPQPLLSTTPFLPSTTPFTPHYSTPRPEEQPQFIPPEREHFLQIQSPIPTTTFGQFQHQLQSQGQPQLSSFEEPRPQIYVNQQYPFDISQEHQNLNAQLNNAQLHQSLVDNFGPPQGYVPQQIPRPQHQSLHRLPLGFPPNPDLQSFDPHNPQPPQFQLHNPQSGPLQIHQPQPSPLQIHQPQSSPLQMHPSQLNYAPNMHEQFQLPEHPLFEEQQYFPNFNSPGRMIHTFYPNKKSDENPSEEQDSIEYRYNSDNSGEHLSSHEDKSSLNEYDPNVNKEYEENSIERNMKIMSNENIPEPNAAHSEPISSRTDSKIQFDYVDSKTRIQPHGTSVIGENLKSEHSREHSHENDNDNRNTTLNRNVDSDQVPYRNSEQNTGPLVEDVVQKYVEDYNRQESKQSEQISDPDFVIQKSLQTDYQLFSKEEENKQEENRLVPLNYVTPIPPDNTVDVSNQKSNQNTYSQLSDRNPQSSNKNNNMKTENIIHGHQNPQVQHHHFTQHVLTGNYGNAHQSMANKQPIVNHAIYDFQQKNFPNSQSFSQLPILHEGNSQNLNDIPVLFHNNLNTNGPNFFGNTFKSFDTSKSPVDNSNINPAHYLIKDSDMPTVLLNTEGTRNDNSKPNVKSYVQFLQPNGKNHQVLQGVVKSDPKVLKPQEVPLVINPLHFAAQTQTIINPSNNDKVKIIIPTITEHQAPIQNIHYKLPKGEVQINRFLDHTIKSTTKPSDSSVFQLKHPQTSQNNQITGQPLSFSGHPESLQSHQNQNLNHNTQYFVAPKHQSPQSLEIIKHNIENLQSKIKHLQDQTNFKPATEPQILQNGISIGSLKFNNKQPSAFTSPNIPLSQELTYQNIIQNFQGNIQKTPFQHQNVQNFQTEPQNTQLNQLSPQFTIPNYHFQNDNQNTQSHRPVSQEFINQNIQNFQRNIQNIPKAEVLNSPHTQTNQPITHIPSTHQHYDIFGEYGQRKQNKEPYRFEPPTFTNHFNPAQATTAHHVNNYHANNRHSPHNMQVFQPIVLDFNNPNGNVYYRNKNIGGGFNRPEISGPVQLPSNLVNGVESESITSKQKKHPSFSDLSSDHSEFSLKTINISGTNLKNPWFHSITKPSLDQKRVNSGKEELTPMIAHLTMSQNSKPSPTHSKSRVLAIENDSSNETGSGSVMSGEIMEKIETSSKNLSSKFNFENNGHNVPILVSRDTGANSEENNPHEKLKSEETSDHAAGEEDNMKLEMGNKQNPEESYERLGQLNDSVGTFSNNKKTVEVSPLQTFMDSFKRRDNNSQTKSEDKGYIGTLNKSYDIIRQSMKEEDERDTIDISGLYNNGDKGNRTSKRLFNKYVNILRTSPKTKQKTKSDAQYEQTKQNVYGKTIDINYFNRRKNGLYSNEDAFDGANILDEDKGYTGDNNKYSTRIINLLKSKATSATING